MEPRTRPFGVRGGAHPRPHRSSGGAPSLFSLKSTWKVEGGRNRYKWLTSPPWGAWRSARRRVCTTRDSRAEFVTQFWGEFQTFGRGPAATKIFTLVPSFSFTRHSRGEKMDSDAIGIMIPRRYIWRRLRGTASRHSARIRSSGSMLRFSCQSAGRILHPTGTVADAHAKMVTRWEGGAHGECRAARGSARVPEGPVRCRVPRPSPFPLH